MAKDKKDKKEKKEKPMKEKHLRRTKGVVENPTNLYEIAVGQTVWVTSIDVEDPNMRRRLQDIGIIEGTRIMCKQTSPSGNPKSYFVRGATVAIRQGDSSLIKITTVPPDDVETFTKKPSADAGDETALDGTQGADGAGA